MSKTTETPEQRLEAAQAHLHELKTKAGALQNDIEAATEQANGPEIYRRQQSAAALHVLIPSAHLCVLKIQLEIREREQAKVLPAAPETVAAYAELEAARASFNLAQATLHQAQYAVEDLVMSRRNGTADLGALRREIDDLTRAIARPSLSVKNLERVAA